MFELETRQQSVALMVLCPISLALMGYAVKTSHHLPVALVLLARFGISALVYASWLWVRGFEFRTIRPSRHILRTVLGFCSVACLFGSISKIPLSTALCLSYTVPIFSYVISVCLGHVKADLRFLYVAGAVAAIAMIVQPSAAVKDMFGFNDQGCFGNIRQNAGAGQFDPCTVCQGTCATGRRYPNRDGNGDGRRRRDGLTGPFEARAVQNRLGRDAVHCGGTGRIDHARGQLVDQCQTGTAKGAVIGEGDGVLHRFTADGAV